VVKPVVGPLVKENPTPVPSDPSNPKPYKAVEDSRYFAAVLQNFSDFKFRNYCLLMILQIHLTILIKPKMKLLQTQFKTHQENLSTSYRPVCSSRALTFFTPQNVYNNPSHSLKYFHDFRLVWPFEISGSGFVAGDND
jgi:Gpi18-like mannosyltransferase